MSITGASITSAPNCVSREDRPSACLWARVTTMRLPASGPEVINSATRCACGSTAFLFAIAIGRCRILRLLWYRSLFTVNRFQDSVGPARQQSLPDFNAELLGIGSGSLFAKNRSSIGTGDHSSQQQTSFIWFRVSSDRDLASSAQLIQGCSLACDGRTRWWMVKKFHDVNRCRVVCAGLDRE